MDVTEKDPVAVTDLLRRGRQNHQEGRLDAAEALYRQALECDADHPMALHWIGILAYQRGRYEEAIEYITRATGVDAGDPSRYSALGLAYQASGRPDEAVACFRKALQLDPDFLLALFHLGNGLCVQGDYDNAKRIYQRALAGSPAVAELYRNLGNVLAELGNGDEAITHLRHASRIDPTSAETHRTLGGVHGKRGALRDAVLSFRTAIALAPDYAEAYEQLADACHLQEEPEVAIDCLRKALALKPNCVELHESLARMLMRQESFDDASGYLLKALIIQPECPGIHIQLGISTQKRREHVAAVAHFERALSIDPRSEAACCNLATSLLDCGDRQGAIECLRKALTLQAVPASADTYNRLGVIYFDIGKLDDAVDCLQQAIRIRPDFAGALNNLGNVHIARAELDEAVALCRRAMDINPGLTMASINLGSALLLQGRTHDALACFEGTLLRKPDHAAAYTNKLLALNYLCGESPQALYAAHVGYAERFEAPLRGEWPVHVNDRDPTRRLKIGYVSGDFCDHSVAYFMEPILAHHDKTQVEVYCYYNQVREDAVTERLKLHPGHWLTVPALDDAALAGRIRADGIDILVDLAGHTARNRLPVFARKPAPVQVSYLGYVATTGLSAMDYRLTNADADPPGNEDFNSERLYRMPRAPWCFRPAADSPAVQPVPPMARNGYVTFASLNNFAKLTPEMLAIWAAVLHAVPDSRLRLVGVPEGTARRLLYQRMAGHGITAERLMVEGKVSTPRFRLLHREIDIALDPYPHNGNTTTCESLWMGVPVISLTGSHFVSRFGYTLLKAVGLSDLAGHDEASYVEISAALAADQERLGQLRLTLRERMAASPLRDEVGFTRELEAAYRAMWRAWCLG